MWPGGTRSRTAYTADHGQLHSEQIQSTHILFLTHYFVLVNAQNAKWKCKKVVWLLCLLFVGSDS